jgi:hypothetical protein
MTGNAGTWVKALARRYGVRQVVRFLEKLPEGVTFGLWLVRAAVLPSVWPEALGLVVAGSISLGGACDGVWALYSGDYG